MSLAGLSGETLALYAGLFGGAMVLLYLLRVRRRTVYVPFSPLWARVLDQQRATSLFRRLQRPGSLLLQLVLVGLLVFALGDPRMGGSATGCRYEAPPEGDTTASLILIDTSASMRAVHAGRSRLEEAIALARTAANEKLALGGRRVMLGTFDVTATPATGWTNDAAVVDRALAALSTAGAREVGTAPEVALSFAQDAIRALPGADVQIFSDFAFDHDFSSLSFTPGVVGAPGDNLGLETFNVRPMPDDPLTYVAWYAVRNDTARPVKAQLYLYAARDGRTAADFTAGNHLIHSEALTLNAGESKTQQIPNLKFEGDRVMARVALDDGQDALDVFPSDDVAFAVVPERRRLRVQLVTAGNTFLSAALSLRENLAITTRSPADYRDQLGFDITVLDGVALRGAPGGRVLQVAPPDLPSTGVLTEVETRITDPRAPLMRGVTVVDWNISEMARYETLKSDAIIIADPAKAPILWSRKDIDGTRRVIISFDLKKSLLPMNLAFPLLIVNALNVLAEEADGVFFPLATGHTRGVPLPFDAERVDVLRPDGSREEVPVLGKAARLDLSAPGIYELRGASDASADQAPRHTVAVNLMAPAESRLTPRPPDIELATQPKDEATLSPTDEPEGAPLWRWLIFLAIALIVIEQLSWHRRWTV